MPSPKFCALDYETNGLEWWDDSIIPTDLAWFNDAGHGDVLQLPEQEGRAKGLMEHINSNGIRCVFHNAKFDLRFFSKANLPMPQYVEDTMLLARIVHPTEISYGLKPLSKKYLNEPYLEEERIKQWASRQKRAGKPHVYGLAPNAIRIPYAQKDAECTIMLWVLMWGAATKKQKRLYKNEMRVLRCVMDMEKRGLLIDLTLAGKMMEVAKTKREKLGAKLRKLTGKPQFNPNSPKQIVEAIYGSGETKIVRRTKKGKAATDRLALIQVDHPLAGPLLAYREWDKLGGTYLKPFVERQDGGIIHPSWNQAGTKTGRFSSSGPNFQNLPRPSDSALGRIKSLIRARPGYRLLLIDYEQLEIRICAHYSQEAHLLEAIHGGLDLQGVTCKVTFDKKETDPDWKEYRYYAKTLNFLLQYGGGAQKLVDTVMSQTGTKLTLYRASKLKERYAERNPRVMSLFDSVATEVSQTGGVENIFGRFVDVPLSKTYVGVNYKIQGSAADLIKFKMPEVRQLIKGHDTHMLLQVHDELGFEVSKKDKILIPKIVRTMEEYDLFDVPITCSVAMGNRWGTKRDIPHPLRH